MKIIKSNNGEMRAIVSRDELVALCRKNGIKIAQSELADQLYEKYQMTKTSKPIYVSIYSVTRNYGGPEEGGWWYTQHVLESTKKFYDSDEAEEFAENLRDAIDNGGFNSESLSSSKGFDKYPDPSGGDPMYDHSDTDIPVGFSGDDMKYDVIVEKQPGENQTKEVPRYE